MVEEPGTLEGIRNVLIFAIFLAPFIGGAYYFHYKEIIEDNKKLTTQKQKTRGKKKGTGKKAKQ